MPYKNKEDNRKYQREWRKRNPDYQNEWARRHPEVTLRARHKYLSNPDNKKKHNARTTVYHAIKRGKLTRPELCSTCKLPGKIEADHHDYDKPYDITWLCRSCHVLLTNKRKAYG